jgi:hypothetical protein
MAIQIHCLLAFGFTKLHISSASASSRRPDMEVIGAGSKAFHHNVQKPRQTDTHGTADPTQRDALTQQVFNHGALLVPDATVFGRGHKRALARVTLMILLRMAGMAIFLVPDRSTLWARFSDDHSCW